MASERSWMLHSGGYLSADDAERAARRYSLPEFKVEITGSTWTILTPRPT